MQQLLKDPATLQAQQALDYLLSQKRQFTRSDWQRESGLSLNWLLYNPDFNAKLRNAIDCHNYVYRNARPKEPEIPPPPVESGSYPKKKKDKPAKPPKQKPAPKPKKMLSEAERKQRRSEVAHRVNQIRGQAIIARAEETLTLLLEQDQPFTLKDLCKVAGFGNPLWFYRDKNIDFRIKFESLKNKHNLKFGLTNSRCIPQALERLEAANNALPKLSILDRPITQKDFLEVAGITDKWLARHSDWRKQVWEPFRDAHNSQFEVINRNERLFSDSVARVESALQELLSQDEPFLMRDLVKLAKVSKSWLSHHPDWNAKISKARDEHNSKFKDLPPEIKAAIDQRFRFQKWKDERRAKYLEKANQAIEILSTYDRPVSKADFTRITKFGRGWLTYNSDFKKQVFEPFQQAHNARFHK